MFYNYIPVRCRLQPTNSRLQPTVNEYQPIIIKVCKLLCIVNIRKLILKILLTI